MKTLMTGILVTAAFCAASLAQQPSPAQEPSPSSPQDQTGPAAPTSPTAQPATPQTTSPRPSTQSTPQGSMPQTQSASPQSSTTPARQTKIAPGSVIPVQLVKTIDAKKMKTGDPVEARVTQDLKATNGELIIPKDTKVVGHVTESQARNKEQKESQVVVAFDRAVINGGDVNLPMSIQAIIAPQSLHPNSNSTGNGEQASQTSSAPTGGAPGTAAASGAGPARGGAMGSGEAPQASSAPTGGNESQGSDSASASHPPITGNTQGVIGISNLKLAPAAGATNASVLTSDKNNVKVESGTFMLLRVSQ
jgi:hypothetical protein